MSIQSVGSSHSSVYSLDEILQDTHEPSTEEFIDNEKTYQNYQDALNEELKTTDRVWLEFHAGLCRHFGKAAKSILYRIVKSSVNHPENSVAAANAITILKLMKVSFSCLDLRGVQIPNADLSSAILDGADLSEAYLENVNLANASLNGTNMSMAYLRKVKFEIPNTLIHKDAIFSSIISPDGNYLISADAYNMYFWDLSSKTYIKKKKRYNGSFYQPHQVIFSPDGKFLFIYDCDKNVNIWSVEDFNHIKKLEDSFEGSFSDANPYVVFSPDGTCFITWDRSHFVYNSKPYLKFWSIQKTENNSFDISLKNEIIVPYPLSNIYISKKFPIFYCSKREFSREGIKLSLCIWNIENLSEIANMGEIYNYTNTIKLIEEKDPEFVNELFSLGIWDASKNNEEILTIALGNTIYSVNIFKKNKQNWALESAQITKITTDIGIIHSMKILEKTHELIYICNNVICLYSIKNNQHIGKFRLLDAKLPRLPISSDGVNISINYLNKVFIYSIEALKNNRFFSYEIDNQTAHFFTDMLSISSFSNSWLTYVYDIETGNILKPRLLQKIKSLVSKKRYYNLSSNTQHILIEHSTYLDMINIENEETYLENLSYKKPFVISNNSEYLAFVDEEDDGNLKKKCLIIYKITSSKKCACVGKFYFKTKLLSYVKSYSPIAMSKDFRSNPKIALMKKANTFIIYNFIFKDETLEPISQKELSVKLRPYKALQLLFTENNSKLIIACDEKIIIWDIEHNQHEEYNIKADCLDISQDGSLFIYYNQDKYASLGLPNPELCLCSIGQGLIWPLITQPLSLDIKKLHISPDKRYILATTENGGMYAWKILENSFRLLWRMSHNLQTYQLILGDNKLEKDIEEDLITKMGAIKLQSKNGKNSKLHCQIF